MESVEEGTEDTRGSGSAEPEMDSVLDESTSKNGEEEIEVTENVAEVEVEDLVNQEDHTVNKNGEVPRGSDAPEEEIEGADEVVDNGHREERGPTSSPSGRSATHSDKSDDESRRRIETDTVKNSKARSASPKRRRHGSKSPGRKTRSRTPSPSPRRKRPRSRSPRRSRSRSGSRRRDRDSDRNGEKRRRSRTRSPRRRSRSPPTRGRYPRFSERDNPKPSRCIGVFGLSTRTREKDLRDEFGKYGPLDNVQLIHDHKTGRSRGFGFVYFTYQEDARDARDAANGMILDDRRIRVDFSLTQRNRSPPRSPPRSSRSRSKGRRRSRSRSRH